MIVNLISFSLYELSLCYGNGLCGNVVYIFRIIVFETSAYLGLSILIKTISCKIYIFYKRDLNLRYETLDEILPHCPQTLMDLYGRCAAFADI